MSTISMAGSITRDATKTAKDLVFGDPSPHLFWEIAQSLNRKGLQKRDKVACLKITTLRGIGPITHAKWARLTQTQIVASIHSSGAEPLDLKRQAIESVAHVGATVIVAEHIDGWTTVVPWERLGTSNYWAYFLSPRRIAEHPPIAPAAPRGTVSPSRDRDLPVPPFLESVVRHGAHTDRD